MPTLPALPKTLSAALAAHAATTPEEPWLFFRQRHDWRWVSWSQIAHQVSEGARILRESGVKEVPFADRSSPDAVALALAIEVAGGQPVSAVGDKIPDFVLPTVPSRLSRWTPDLESLRGTPESPPESPEMDVWQIARLWHEKLPAARPKKRPIVLSSAAVSAEHRQALIAWTLLSGAAWVLEDEEEQFVTAVLRNRPHLVLAPASDAGLLALALTGRFRRWHRLRAVALTDDAPAELAREDEWREMGVPVLRLAV